VFVRRSHGGGGFAENPEVMKPTWRWARASAVQQSEHEADSGHFRGPIDLGARELLPPAGAGAQGRVPKG